MEMSKESWAAMIEGQTRDAQYIQRLQVRLCRMARQVEKLSYMVERMDLVDMYAYEAEAEWPAEAERRKTR